MNRYELVKLNKSLLQTLLENKISPADVRKMEIYEKYKAMLKAKHKVTYIVTHLASIYGMKERGIYSLVSRFEDDVTL